MSIKTFLSSKNMLKATQCFSSRELNFIFAEILLGMTLIKSISGIRGTIGGCKGDNLTPVDILKFVTGYAAYIASVSSKEKKLIVIGRDARISGEMVSKLVSGTLQSLGFDVLDLGLSTTPSVELAVTYYEAQGGIIITASHNPGEWNALKLLNEKGEFLDDQAGKQVLRNAENEQVVFNSVQNLGSYSTDNSFLEKHIEMVLALPLVDRKAIEETNFTIVVDAVNSTGGIAIPQLLKALGVKHIVEINCKPDGLFAHNPEPLPENLKQISEEVVRSRAHLGIVVDPDVDRLALICEDGSMFGEEYTLVAVADYVLKHTPGNTVSNMSSTRALRDVTLLHKQLYTASAVGEVNVVKTMKDTHAIIGGEGNGGIIYPESHYGRDALVGVALFLSHMAHEKLSCSQLKKKYPAYYMSKNKITLTDGLDTASILTKIAERFKGKKPVTIDGVKIDFEKEWVHLRLSNTEPIIRIYSESTSPENADQLAQRFIKEIEDCL